MAAEASTTSNSSQPRPAGFERISQKRKQLERLLSDAASAGATQVVGYTPRAIKHANDPLPAELAGRAATLLRLQGDDWLAAQVERAAAVEPTRSARAVSDKPRLTSAVAENFDQLLSKVDAEFEIGHSGMGRPSSALSDSAVTAGMDHPMYSSQPVYNEPRVFSQHAQLPDHQRSSAAIFLEPGVRARGRGAVAGTNTTTEAAQASQQSATAADASAQPPSHPDQACDEPPLEGDRAPLQRQDSSLVLALEESQRQAAEVHLTNKEVRQQLLQRLAEPRSLSGAASLSSDLARRQRRARLMRSSAQSGQTLLSQVPANIKRGRKTRGRVRDVLGTGSQGRGGPTGGLSAHMVEEGQPSTPPPVGPHLPPHPPSSSQNFRGDPDGTPSAEQLARHILSQISALPNTTAPTKGGAGGLNSHAVMSVAAALQETAAEHGKNGSSPGAQDSTGALTLLLQKLARDPLVPLSRPDMMLTAQELAKSGVGQYIAKYIKRSGGSGRSLAPQVRSTERGGGANGVKGGYASGSSGASLSSSDSDEWEVEEVRREDGTIERKLVPASGVLAEERRRRRAARAERRRALMRTADSVRSDGPIWNDLQDVEGEASATARALARIRPSGSQLGVPAAADQDTKPPKPVARTRAAARVKKMQSGPSAAVASMSPLAVAHSLHFSSLVEPDSRLRSPSAQSSGSQQSLPQLQSRGGRRRRGGGARAGDAMIQVHTVGDMHAVEALLSSRSPRSGRLVGTAAHGSRRSPAAGRGLVNSGFVALAASEAAAAQAARRGARRTHAEHLHDSASVADSSKPKSPRGGGRLSEHALQEASEHAAESLAHVRSTAKRAAEGDTVLVPVSSLRQLGSQATRQSHRGLEGELDFHTSAQTDATAARDRQRRGDSLKRSAVAASAVTETHRQQKGPSPGPQELGTPSMSLESGYTSNTRSGGSGGHGPGGRQTSLQRALSAARASAAQREAQEAERNNGIPQALRSVRSMADAQRSVQFDVVAAAAQAKQRQEAKRRGAQLEEVGGGLSRRGKHDKPWRQNARCRKSRTGRRSQMAARDKSPHPIEDNSEASEAGAQQAQNKSMGAFQNNAKYGQPKVPSLSLGLLDAQSSMHNSTDAAAHAHLSAVLGRVHAFQRLTQQAHERQEAAVEFTTAVSTGAAVALSPLRSYVDRMSDRWGRVATSTAKVHQGREALARAATHYTLASTARARLESCQTGASSSTPALLSSRQQAGRRQMSKRQVVGSSALQSAAAALSSKQQQLAAVDFNTSAAGTAADGTRSKFWQRHGGVRQVALRHLSAADTARRQRMLDHLNEMEAQGIPLPTDSSVGKFMIT